jgi:hypothetical protein
MMALKTKDGRDLMRLGLRLNWKGQTGLEMRLVNDGVVMSLAHVDELIAELIGYRDAMEREDNRARGTETGDES